MKKRVFISYSTKNKSIADKLIKKFKSLGHSVWRDVSSIMPGDDWLKEIDEGLRHSDALVLVITPEAIQSEYVAYEWAFALGAGVPVIPLLYKPVRVPLRLQTIQFLDIRKHKKPWLRLMDSLRTMDKDRASRSSPIIDVSFRLNGRGKPEKVGDEYKMKVQLQNAPQGAVAVKYRLHDKSFDSPVWCKKNLDEKFLTKIQSYGDVLISAKIYLSSGSKLTIESTLYEALSRTHGGSKDERIERALRDIERY